MWLVILDVCVWDDLFDLMMMFNYFLCLFYFKLYDLFGGDILG